MIHSTTFPTRDLAPLPALPTDLPILYEDDDEDEMGESNLHVTTDQIVHVCLKAHLAVNPQIAVYSNMNLYYPGPPSRVSPSPYVSPDVMVVQPFQAPDERLVSYRLNETGPAPLLTVEILSRRSYQQRDLAEKMTFYAKIGVPEYILVDVSGEFLPQKLLLKRLQADGTYKDEQDADGGVTSRLGFRFVIDVDGRLRVIDSRTGHRYVRPDEAEMEMRARRQAQQQAEAEAEARRQAQQQAQAEAEARRQAQQQAQAEAEARRQAEERIKALEAELARLRAKEKP